MGRSHSSITSVSSGIVTHPTETDRDESSQPLQPRYLHGVFRSRLKEISPHGHLFRLRGISCLLLTKGGVLSPLSAPREVLAGRRKALCSVTTFLIRSYGDITGSPYMKGEQRSDAI